MSDTQNILNLLCKTINMCCHENTIKIDYFFIKNENIEETVSEFYLNKKTLNLFIKCLTYIL